MRYPEMLAMRFATIIWEESGADIELRRYERLLPESVQGGGNCMSGDEVLDNYGAFEAGYFARLGEA